MDAFEDGKRKRNLAEGFKETKGLKDGHCNRRACQTPLVDDVRIFGKRHSMIDHETFFRDARLYYCNACAEQFDMADRQMMNAPRITTETLEPYIPDNEEDAAELADNGRNTGGGKMRRWR